MRSALVLTVGTGTSTKLEETILSPFRKSLSGGDWDRILLLPSQSTIPMAQAVQEDNPALAKRIEIAPLPAIGDEYNLDRAFAHFQDVLFALLESGSTADSITVDLTRGTKAMSAALSLAAVSVGIHAIRYIEGYAKDESGMTIAGTEKITDLSAVTVSRSRTLNLIESFLHTGQFAAARAALASDPGLLKHPRYATTAKWLSWAASFWGSWDALHYPKAEECLAHLSAPVVVPPWLSCFVPSDDQCKLLSALGLDSPGSPKEHVPLCRALGADLLANARRRFAQGQTEETLVRVARVVELLGQLRLFEHGLDSSAVDPSHPDVAAWMEKQESKGRSIEKRGGKLILARLRVGSLLKHLKDPLASKLNDYEGWLSGFDAELRNHSVLIHGFVARSRGLGPQIEKWLAGVEAAYREEHPGNAALLVAARFPFFPPTGI